MPTGSDEASHWPVTPLGIRGDKLHFLDAIKHYVYAGDTGLHLAAAAYQRTTAELLIAKKKARLTAEVNNVLNQQYEVVQSYPMPGTNVKFIFNVTL